MVQQNVQFKASKTSIHQHQNGWKEATGQQNQKLGNKIQNQPGNKVPVQEKAAYQQDTL